MLSNWVSIIILQSSSIFPAIVIVYAVLSSFLIVRFSHTELQSASVKVILEVEQVTQYIYQLDIAWSVVILE